MGNQQCDLLISCCTLSVDFEGFAVLLISLCDIPPLDLDSLLVDLDRSFGDFELRVRQTSVHRRVKCYLQYQQQDLRQTDTARPTPQTNLLT